MNLMGNCPLSTNATEEERGGVDDMTHTSLLKEDPSNDDGTTHSSVLRPRVPFLRSPLVMFFL